MMYCHPRWQRTPSAERLRKWYAQIVARLTADGVVVRLLSFEARKKPTTPTVQPFQKQPTDWLMARGRGNIQPRDGSLKLAWLESR